MCTECLRVNGHHPNCPEAEDYDDTEDDLCGDGEEFFQVTGNGPKRLIVVEDDLRHLALQAWVSLYEAQA